MTMHHQLNGSSGSNGVVKTRRSHRKSRNGCSECKRRHIRCDERRPACTNCTIAERACSFPSRQPQAQIAPLPHSPADSHLSRKSQHSPSSCEPDHPGPWPVCPPDLSSTSPESVLGAGRGRFVPAAATGPPTLPSFTESFTNTAYQPPVPPASLFTAEHLMLFHHVSDAMSDCILARGQIKVVLDVAIRHLVDAPYLIDQLLALSALHVAFTTKPGENPLPGAVVSFRHQATELQTRALSSFTRIAAMVPADDTATCVPRFLFASLLSNQVLAETLLQHQQPQPLPYHHDVMGVHGGGSGGGGGAVSFHGFIERMVECIHLHRGILAHIRPTWDYLMQSELYPLLRITHDANITAVTLSSGTECAFLRQMIEAAASSSPLYGGASPPRLDQAGADACRSAIGSLQWAFDMHRALPAQDVPHAPSAFIVTVEAEYVDVLRTLLPEALVILAYLGVLIHRCRRFWTFGTAGANLIRAIAGYLGSHWHEPLAWPLKVIEEETD
ncbi:zn2-c6 fungal-type dna-binding domain [Trichoderma cornu-damae]|uniref:Zn2-c6 fungal-type dna-binding domain n=1 Tax=Trichoderma cornu-damae TaxID=654480 RepID=A0A9P8QQN1_9HYPO|nr:zn2-c6 fungal-type dna-binding domain [Trichoderma cornu-damae]